MDSMSFSGHYKPFPNGDWLRVSCMCIGFVGTVFPRASPIEEFRSFVMSNKHGLRDSIL